VFLQLYNEEIIDLLDTTRDPSLKVNLQIFFSFAEYVKHRPILYNVHHHYVACLVDIAVSTSDLHACRFCAQ